MLPKVSVVVPIYKVENYIRRCVDSILHQTYTNIEVILVDDGSPDKCGLICDEYQQTDSRVKALHKKNGGLSDARNYGMQFVTGEYVLFVDSDDWLDHTMIEEMLRVSLLYNADVVQTAFYYAYDDYLLLDNRYVPLDQETIVIETQSLMGELVKNERVKNFAWGKLLKVEFIREIPFKKGVLFEDVFWAHQVMHQVQVYIIMSKPMYYYYQRNDSIVANYSPRHLDFLRGLKERHHFIEKFYTDLINDSYKEIVRHSFIHFNLLYKNRRKDGDGRYRREIQDYVSGNYFKLKNAVADDRELRKQLFLFKTHPYLSMVWQACNKLYTKLFGHRQQLERLQASNHKG